VFLKPRQSRPPVRETHGEMRHGKIAKMEKSSAALPALRGQRCVAAVQGLMIT
jgi:hypothetical protein